MKMIEKGSVKYLVVLIITTAIFGMILYPLFDIIFCKFITNSEFIYSVKNHIIEPMVFACIFGTTFWLVDRKRNK